MARRYNLNLPGVRTTQRPVSFMRRGFAFVLDLFLVNLFLLGPFRGMLNKVIPLDESTSYSAIQSLMESDVQVASVVFTASLGAGVVALLYFALLQFKFGKTIGMHFLRINMVSGKKEQLTFWQCLLRNVFVIPVFPFIVFWVLDPLFLFFGKTHQRLLEKWSSTKLTQTMVI